MTPRSGRPTPLARRSRAPAAPDWLRAYALMQRIRCFEDRVDALYRRGVMPGLAHLSSGEEAVAVGLCLALREGDRITSTHRGHGHCLAKGAGPREMFCELLGKAEGTCSGKGGSMHIADPARGNLGANAIVAGSTGIATGAALASARLGSGEVTACFFGDGALGQGLLYEVMNMAVLWRLPVVYVCENNLYGEYTATTETLSSPGPERARAFGMPATEVDGQDVRAVHRVAREAVARARAGQGPSFLWCTTYRFFGHHVGDVDRTGYRTREEERFWRQERDPIAVLGAWLEAEGLADRAHLEQRAATVAAEIDAAQAYALEAPYPEPSAVSLDVYA